MNDSIIVRTEKDYKVSKWSGGDTTELYLYPEDGDYKSGNFQLRISSATVEADRSEFTSLPGVDRYLMIFQGHLDMIHGEKEKISLEPYEVDHFDGGVPTVSYGKVVDFNLMLKNVAKGKMEALCLEKGKESKIQPRVSSAKGSSGLSLQAASMFLTDCLTNPRCKDITASSKLAAEASFGSEAFSKVLKEK